MGRRHEGGVRVRGTWVATGIALAVWATPALGSGVQDPDYGYSVSMPKFPAPAAGTAMMRFNVAAPPENGFAPNVNVMVQEVKFTREEFIALSQKQFVATGAKVLSSSHRDVGGRPAVLLEYQATVQEHDLHFLQLAVMLPERVLLVTCTAPAARFAQLAPEFRRVLDSFKLQPGATR
jgi:hypothetical protein